MNELQAQLQEVTDQLAQLDPNNRDNLVEIAGLEQKKAVLIMKMDDAKAQEEQQAAQQVRIQAQEEKVESITLPYNFDDIFDNKNANEMIIELVKEFQRKAYEDHNDDVDRINSGWKIKLDEITSEWSTTKTQLQEEIGKLHQENKTLQGNLEDTESALEQANFLGKDAESKRDAAVKQLEEAQSEIAQLKSWNDDLRAQAAQGVRKAIDVIDISPSEKLAAMVKESAAEKANRALARWADVIEVQPVVVAPPIAPEVPTFQPGDIQTDDTTDQLDETGFIPIPADHQEVAPITFPVSSGDAVDNGLSSENGSQAETVSRQEFEALKATVKELCEVCNVAEVA
jgi:chromosome segregation ATPase